MTSFTTTLSQTKGPSFKKIKDPLNDKKTRILKTHLILPLICLLFFFVHQVENDLTTFWYLVYRSQTYDDVTRPVGKKHYKPEWTEKHHFLVACLGWVKWILNTLNEVPCQSKIDWVECIHEKLGYNLVGTVERLEHQESLVLDFLRAFKQAETKYLDVRKIDYLICPPYDFAHIELKEISRVNNKHVG